MKRRALRYEGAGRWSLLLFLIIAAPPALAAGQGTVEAAPDSAPPAKNGVEAAEPSPAEPGEAKSKEDPVAQAYLRKCVGCHTIGGGNLSGPDLKPVAQWPREQVYKAVERMEQNVGPMSEEEISKFTGFLLDPQAGQRLEAEQQRAAMRAAAHMEPASAEVGEQLYFGTKPFKNGGISCAACHQAGGRGGSLATSLEDAYTRIGKQPLISTCVNPGYPVMRAMYEPQPVTQQEAVHLVKFLEKVSEEEQQAAFVPLDIAGLVGTVIVLALIGRGHRHRITGVRARLVAEARRKSNLGESPGKAE